MMNGLIAQLPHRPPFSFVTEVVSFKDGVLEAAWKVQGDENFLSGHFPNDPIVPGVLILESLAQAAGIHLLAIESGAAAGRDGLSPDAPQPRPGMLVQSEIRFRRPVRPPARLLLTTRLDGGMGALYRFTVEARDGDALAASGSLVIAVGG